MTHQVTKAKTALYDFIRRRAWSASEVLEVQELVQDLERTVLRSARNAIQERKHSFVCSDPDNTSDDTLQWMKGKYDGAQAAEDVITGLLSDNHEEGDVT